MQTLTSDNAPKIGATVTAIDYKGDTHTGVVTSRDWSFEQLSLITVTVTPNPARRWDTREVRIWAGRDQFEAV